MPTQEGIDEAFDLIVNLATNLQVDYDLPEDVEKKLEMIVALARYQNNVLSKQDMESINEWRSRFNESQLPTD